MKKVMLVLAGLCLGAVMAFGSAATETTTSSMPVVQWYLGTWNQTVLDDMKTISKYAEDKIGIGLELAPVDGAQFEPMIQTGQPMDLVGLDGDGNFIKWIEMGGMLDITTKVKTVTPNLYKAIPTAVWDAVTYKGKIWAVPEYKDSASTWFVIWDTRSVNKYGIQDMIKAKDSTTTEGMDQIARYIRSKDPSFYIPQGGIPLGLEYDGFGGPGHPILAVRYDDQSRTVISPLAEDPKMLAALKVIRQQYLDGLYAPDQITHPGDPYKPADLGAAVWSGGSGWPSAASIWAGWNHNPDGTIPIENYTGPQLSTSFARAITNFVGVNSTHPDEALKMMELICTDPLFRDMLAYGVEGKHFTYVTRPVGQTPGVIHRTGVNWEGPPAYRTGNWFIETSSGTKSILSSPDDDLNRLGEIAEQSSRATVSPLMGFTFDLDGAQGGSLRITSNNLTAILDKYKDKLGLGVEEPETLINQLMTELNAAGLQKVKAEAQRQINEWVKTLK